MILLYNVFITDKSSTGGQWENLGVSYDRGNLNSPNKLEILKYSLASYAVAYPWKKVILNLELDPDYISLDKKQELKDFALNEFKDTEIIYSDRRNLLQQDWVNTYELLNDDIIFYQGNHDHNFIDNSTSYLEELDELKAKYGKNLTISTSHFPEAIRTAKCGYIDHHETQSTQPSEDYKIESNHIYRKGRVLDSLIIITKEIYKNWFVEDNWEQIQVPQELFKSGQMELARTEGTGIIGLGGIKDILKTQFIDQKIVIPFKELFRHFDGYGHQKISNSNCPALDIPPGFFEKDIKIRYGYDNYLEGWVNINPKTEHYKAFNKLGTDYKFTLENLPLVWIPRISFIDSNPDINHEEMVQYELKSILEMVYTNPKYDIHIESELETKILNKYLESHPGYKI